MKGNRSKQQEMRATEVVPGDESFANKTKGKGDDRLGNLKGSAVSKTISKPKPFRYDCAYGSLVRPGVHSGSDATVLKATQIAIKWYNRNHKGEEIQLLEWNVACNAGTLARRYLHINFMAKPVNAGSGQSKKQCFFADVDCRPKFIPRMCEKLVEGSANYQHCGCCRPAYGVVHPRLLPVFRMLPK